MQISNDLFDAILLKSAIFKDETTLFRDFIPEELPCRESELAMLARTFRPILKGKSLNVLVTGKPGSGKTCLTKYFCARLEEFMNKSNRKLKSFYYNCFVNKSRTSLVTHLLNIFQINSRGLGFESAIALIKRRLIHEKINLILILDECQYLEITDLQAFLELSEQFPDNPVSIIGIMRSGLDEILKIMKLGAFQEEISLKDYTKDDLFKILQYRAELAFEANLGEDVLELAATIAAATNDARHGIELLYHAGKMAEQRGLHHISLDLIRESKMHVFPEIDLLELETLTKPELLVCFSIVKSLKNRVAIKPREVFHDLKIVSEEFGMKLMDFKEFNTIIKYLTKRGLFELKNDSKIKDSIKQHVMSYEIPFNVFEDRIQKVFDLQ
ncbi:MAG: Cdc6/Cdc18 family protein [Candidatus Helarchaeota archaeon]